MKSLDLKIPDSWNALNRKQLLYVCRLYRLNLTELKFKTWVFVKFTGIKALPKKVIADRVYYFFRKKKLRFSLTPDELHWFLHSVDYLLSESRLTKNLFPSIRIFHKRLYGPSNSCYNISVHEFLFAESMIDGFHHNKDLKYLRYLCAILYRPRDRSNRPGSPGFTGDRRQLFNDYTFEARSRWFRLVSPNVLYAVYVFFVGCRNAIIEKHPYLFNTTSVSSEPVNHMENIKNLLASLNQGDITRNKKILQTQVWEAFGQLNELAKQTKQVKQKR
jgi:hypothetical protein